MFVGIFSESVCKWLRAKREDLACSFKEIGVIIGVNWATVRKWELGLVKRCQPHNVRALRCYFMGKTECSGNVTKERLKEIAEIGVDFVSCGALTHSAMIMDVSLKNLTTID